MIQIIFKPELHKFACCADFINEFDLGKEDLVGCEEGRVYEELEALLNNILPKKSMKEYGTKSEEFSDFAQSVMDNQGRLMANAFVPLDYERVLKIYRELY